MAHVYTIILNYKKWDEVAECLETLFRSGYDNFTAIVIDNDSQNNSLDNLVSWAENNTSFSNPVITSEKNIQKPIQYAYLLEKELNGPVNIAAFPKLVFIENDTNKGFAGGINGVLNCLLNEDAHIWLLNPDMIVEPTALNELVKFAATVPRKSIIGSVIKYYDDPQKIHFYGGGKINFNAATVELITNKKEIPQLDYISGGSFFTHAGSFAELGLLPEDYFLYWEETDCCYRAKEKGYQLRVCETAVCYDKVSTNIGKNFLSDYYYTRNGLYFLSKYKAAKVSTAIFFTIFRLIKRIASFQFNRASGMYQGMRSFLNKNKHAYK